jgi:hypothetical protein
LQSLNKNLKEEQESIYNKSLLKALKDYKKSPRSPSVGSAKRTPFKSITPYLIKGATWEVPCLTYSKSLKLFLIKRVTN